MNIGMTLDFIENAELYLYLSDHPYTTLLAYIITFGFTISYTDM